MTKIAPRIKLTVYRSETERLYVQRLEFLRCAGEIIRWEYECWKCRLADGLFYVPDFRVIFPTHIEFHEIKGAYTREKAVQKFKIAAELYPDFIWKMIQWKNKEWHTIYEI
ncbi:DUF1064 domain-containing protein [bacterium]|nr:DUF1064 domain-containing protein [bacterium]